jgi:hypothetical protein
MMHSPSRPASPAPKLRSHSPLNSVV